MGGTVYNCLRRAESTRRRTRHEGEEMEYCSLPDRPVTTRWRRLGTRAVALLEGALACAGVLLAVDAARSLFTPDAALLGVLVRWPGGAPLPAPAGAALAAAFLFRRRWLAVVLLAFLVLALLNVIEFYTLRGAGLPAAVLPFSLVTVALLVAAVGRLYPDGRALPWPWRAAGAAAAGPSLLLLHLFSFGLTDYTRRADAIVVFGAGVYSDGSPSLALEDRVRHGVRLYRRGVAPVVVMSGGPDETPVMKRLAVAWGVPAEALELDPEGVNTYATLRNLRHRSVLAVSHYYHLARIKLAARRAGVRAVTVPCPMTRRLAREPYFIARECAAFAAYYFFRG